MKRLWLAIGALFAVSMVVDLLIGATVPGLFAVYGLVGCIVIIVASKWLGHALLQRREEYYERGPRG